MKWLQVVYFYNDQHNHQFHLIRHSRFESCATPSPKTFSTLHRVSCVNLGVLWLFCILSVENMLISPTVLHAVWTQVILQVPSSPSQAFICLIQVNKRMFFPLNQWLSTEGLEQKEYHSKVSQALMSLQFGCQLLGRFMRMAVTGLKGQWGEKKGSQPISNSLQESDRSDDMHGTHIAEDGRWETFPCKGAFWLQDYWPLIIPLDPTYPLHFRESKTLRENSRNSRDGLWAGWMGAGNLWKNGEE